MSGVPPISFGPRAPRPLLIIISGVLSLGFCGLIALLVVDEWTHGGTAGRIAAVLVAGAGTPALLVLLAAILWSPFRFSYQDDGVWVRTWRGRRFFRWSDVAAARLRIEVMKSTRFLMLRLVFRPGGRVGLPIDQYRRPQALVTLIRRSIPVPLTGLELADGLRDAEDSGAG